MKVFVYFNLHKKLFSVRALEGEKRGKVIAHMPMVTLENPKFKVSKAGRERVLREQRKNVHAGVVGDFCLDIIASNKIVWEHVRYNPYLFDSFVTQDNQPVAVADVAHLQVLMSTQKPTIRVGNYVFN